MSDETSGVVEPISAGIDQPRTVAEILRAAHEKAQANRKPKDVVLPGYGEPVSELHLLFEMLPDYGEVREVIKRALSKRGLDQDKREIQVGLETLTRASVGSYALIDGERHDLHARLGLELYEHLHPQDELPPSDDLEATVLLFDSNTTMVMGVFHEVDAWMRRGGRDAEEETLGK